MFGDSIQFQVVTPERTVMRDVTIKALVVPSTEGYLGILPNHAPMVAALKPGVVRYKEGEHFYVMAVGAGFAEISDNQATLLVDSAEPGHEININEARAHYEHIVGRLGDKDDPMRQEEDALAAFEVAKARLKAAEITHSAERRH